MNEVEELEWAARNYAVMTEHLCEVLERFEGGVPPSITGALMLLSQAINTTWGEETAQL